jgi:hypothetical protein
MNQPRANLTPFSFVRVFVIHSQHNPLDDKRRRVEVREHADAAGRAVV